MIEIGKQIIPLFRKKIALSNECKFCKNYIIYEGISAPFKQQFNFF